VPVVVVLLCAGSLLFYAAQSGRHRPIYAVAETVSIEPSLQPMTEVPVVPEGRLIDGKLRMPTWRELFERYRMPDEIRESTIALYNTRRAGAGPPAQVDDPVPENTQVIIELKVPR
jgi:hypothetical protein